MKLHTFITKIFFAALLAVFAVSANAGITVTYFHNDLTGSPVAATNETGQVVWRKNYTPYGETAGKDRDNRVGYTGHQEESNGLVYAGARYYDPALGRFMSVDPKGFSDKNPMSFNRYAYANNNPYKYVDPSGSTPETIWDAANVAMGVASFAANAAAGNYGGAAVDAVGIVVDVAATITPVVPGGAGTVIKAVRGADKVIHIGKVDDLKNVPRNQTILDELPDLGSPKANWKQNSSVLRGKVREGYEIRDASKHRSNSSPDPTPLRPDRTVGQSFLGAERNLLDNLGVTPK